MRIHRPVVGYALEEPATFLGSGFFVAPNWVLTCAHVACGGEGGEVAVVYGTAPGRGVSTAPGRVVATLPDLADGLGRTAPAGNWPAPDLALVQLTSPVVDHECVYVSERPAAYYGEGRVLYAGWTENEGRLQVMDGTLTVQGTIGGWSSDVQMRLGDNDLPYGVSGGPVIDPVRGEVIGVLKARSDHRPGGTSTGIEQLRTLRVPAERATAEHSDVYQAVFHAHDRYHRDRQRHPASRRQTWTDVQGRLGARPGRTLSPDERIQLLGRLAELPPPQSTRGLLDVLDSLPDFQVSTPLPAPRGWRDGLGALYECAGDDGALELVLDYAMRAMSAPRPFVVPSTPDAEKALWVWVWQAAQRLSARYRSGLAEQRMERLRRREEARRRADRDETGGDLDRPGTVFAGPGTVLEGPLPPRPSPDVVPTGGGPRVPRRRTASDVRVRARTVPGAARPSALVELVLRGWEPDRCDWSVSVAGPGGGAVRLHEAERTPLADLAAHLAGPLAEAFRHCDEPGRPALLQVALPHALLGLEVDAWQLAPGMEPLGALRPVVVRCADRDRLPGEGYGEYGADDPDPDRRDRAGRPDRPDRAHRDRPDRASGHDRDRGDLDALDDPQGRRDAQYPEDPHDRDDGDDRDDLEEERRARWRWLHTHRARAEVLDCDEGLRKPVPSVEQLRALSHGTVPVLCRYGDLRYEDDAEALARIVLGGYGVALWRRRHGRPDAVCGEFHRGTIDEIAEPSSAQYLPEAVHDLRMRLREGRTESFWADGVALLYDDPHQPLPGDGDLLEAP
ncbi:trypsin-like peptidase domain-containing protein [Streptomyces scabiei]|uniref:VMAP-C domain-containing protein n=1 Tax=Streptomyces scabiei TaxID=1930 RepID=UPI0029B6140A|nr:trypsin-like peptidase domain-containing protein [Streptomyces scabiei]MDX3113888.1 trypsin-like peptidase domain-containing protein [Streptomyces scabiei]